MDHFDEFSKSLAEAVPRRESLRRLGAVFAGALLGPFVAGTAWAGPRAVCKAFCNCGTRRQRSQCLDACLACNADTSRLGGTCGSYTCCAVTACNGVCSNLNADPNCGACGNDCGALGETCCGNYCADLDNDVANCGACGAQCAAPAPGESVTCVFGSCVYGCAEGAVECNGTCTDVNSDPANCGACGSICPESAPVCLNGKCSEEQSCIFPFVNCGGICVDPTSDRFNCGGCGVQCAADEACISGFCESGGG
jgi:Stigma-specific protein, Stig1